MKFYNRETELQILENHYKNIDKTNGIILDVLIGRRRIGKTELTNQFVKNKKHLYFFVSRKPLKALLKEWTAVVQKQYPAPSQPTDLDDLLEWLFQLGQKEKLIIIFDEFQNFNDIYQPAFSVFQKFYDKYHQKSKILLLLLGSIITLMEKIFTNVKEPLFGRATRRLHIRSLGFTHASQMAKDLGFQTSKEMLDLYLIFNGIPGYYKFLENEGLNGQPLEIIIQTLLLHPQALLKNEGEFLVREIFGKEYANYFEILSLIARGKTKIGEIASEKEMPTSHLSQYLDNLEKKFALVERKRPLFAKPKTRASRYYLKDKLLSFWFRFVYPYLSLIEKGETAPVLQIIKRDLPIYQGKIFESLAHDIILQKSHQNDFIFPITQIGSWWDNKGENEIDVVAVDENKQKIFLGECKINTKRITKQLIDNLLQKSELEIFKKFKEKHLGVVSFGGLNKEQKKYFLTKNIIHIDIKKLLCYN